jgi:hypothetical protein
MARDQLLFLLLKNQQVWANKGEIANENKKKKTAKERWPSCDDKEKMLLCHEGWGWKYSVQ